MSNKAIVSCHNCLDRYPGCHQYCKTYKKERADYDRQKAEANKNRDVDYYYVEGLNKRRDRLTKDKKRFRRRGGYID